MKYISVRDSWTRDMVVSITHDKIIPPVTPDPVFAFNENAGFLVPSEESLRKSIIFLKIRSHKPITSRFDYPANGGIKKRVCQIRNALYCFSDARRNTF